jgi:WD40 repeat protein
LSDDGLYTDPVLVLDPGRNTAPINRLDADHEGRFLVTASHDKTVRVWAASDGSLLRTLRLPAGPGDVGKAYAAAISPDGTLVATGGWTGSTGSDKNIYLFDRASGQLLRRVGGLPDVVLRLAFSPDGSRLAATLGGRNGVRLIDPALGRVVAEDKGYGDQSYGAAFDEAGRLATTSYDGKLRLYDLALRLLRTVPAPGGKRPYGLAFSPDGKRLAVGYVDNIRVDVLDGASLKPLLTPDTKGVENGDLFTIAWSADGASLYAAGRWQVGGEHRLRCWPEGGRGAPVDVALSRSTVMSLRPLPDGRLAFAAQDPRLGLLGGDGREAWSVGPAGADFRGQYDVLAVAADGRRVRFGYEPFGKSPALFALAERRLVEEGSAEGLATARTAAPALVVEGWKNGYEPTLNGKRLALEAYERASSLAIAPDGQRFVLGSEWALRLFDGAGTEIWRRAVPDVVWAVAVSDDGRLVVAAYGDGTIRWHRVGDGEELLAFYPDGDRERWVVWTPRGYYMASSGGEDMIGWHVNRERNDAPEFYAASRFRYRFHRPDVLDLVLKELDVDFAAAEADAAVRRRPIHAEMETLRAAEIAGARIQNIYHSPRAVLYALAIGVNRHRNHPYLDLLYAAHDVHDFCTTLAPQKGGLYKEIQTLLLVDEAATQAEILSGLDWLERSMTPEDVAMVLLAGHGTNDARGEFYFLPHDADLSDQIRLRRTCVDYVDIKRTLTALADRGKTLLFLDACHSGNVWPGTRGVPPDIGAIANDLARAENGVIVFASCTGGQLSQERSEWENGAFTEALLEAFAGKARRDGDRLLVTDIANYVKPRVRELTDGAQTPVVLFPQGRFTDPPVYLLR